MDFILGESFVGLSVWSCEATLKLAEGIAKTLTRSHNPKWCLEVTFDI